MKCLLGHLHYCPHIQIGLFHQCSMQLCGDVGRSQLSVRGPIIFVILNFFFVLLFPSTYPLLIVFSRTTTYRCSTQKCLNLNDTSIRFVCCDGTQSYLISYSGNPFGRRIVSLFTYSELYPCSLTHFHLYIWEFTNLYLTSWPRYHIGVVMRSSSHTIFSFSTRYRSEWLHDNPFSFFIGYWNNIWPLTKNSRGNDQYE